MQKKETLIEDNYERLDNRAIVDKYLENGLIQKCVDMQFIKMPRTDWWKMEYKEDLFQDLIVFLLTYNNEKLNNADHYNHMNALITRIIQNQIYSDHSKFYLDYIRIHNTTKLLDPDAGYRYFPGTKEDD